MATYNFLRGGEIYIVYGSGKYNLGASRTFKFSQTLQEESYSVRTLHNTALSDAGQVTKANPADFSFEVHLTSENREQVLYDLFFNMSGPDLEGSRKLNTCTIYFLSNESAYYITDSILDSITFDLKKDEAMFINVTGQGGKLQRVSRDTADTTLAALTTQNSGSTSEFIGIINPKVDGNVVSNFTGANLQFTNEIDWLDQESIQDTSIYYPSIHRLTKRNISGTINHYVTSDNSDSILSTNTKPIVFEIGEPKKATITLNSCIYTTRVEPADIYTGAYDFRYVGTTGTAGDFITYP